MIQDIVVSTSVGRKKTGRGPRQRRKSHQQKLLLGEAERDRLAAIAEHYGINSQTGALRMAMKLIADERVPSHLPPRIPDESKARTMFTVYLSPDEKEAWSALQEKLKLASLVDVARYAIAKVTAGHGTNRRRRGIRKCSKRA